MASIPNSFSQGVIIDEHFPCYTRYFAVIDRETSHFWDKASDNDAQCYSYYHGGENQKWYIMPTFPGSTEAMFINLDGGEILDRSLINKNIYCYEGVHHGGENQLFHMHQATDDDEFFLLKNLDVPYAVDKGGDGSLQGYSVHWGYNQQFRFLNVGTIPNSDKLTIKKNGDSNEPTENIPYPPQPTSLTDPGSNMKHSYKLVGKTIIPFAFVHDPGRDYQWQAANSPYYIFEHYQYWKLEDPFTIGYGLTYTEEDAGTSGLNVIQRESLETTFGLELTRKSEFGLDVAGALTATLSENIKSIFGLTIKSDYEVEETYQLSQKVSFSKTVDEQLNIFPYRLVDEFKLYRLNSNYPFKEWDNPREGKGLLYSYPSTNLSADYGNKSVGMEAFVQSVWIDLIPRLYQNITPVGIAESSSTLSSSYAAWKAFDGEDESGGWSRWISNPTGVFIEEWLSFKFNDPILIMSYSITPETGGSIERTPSQWKVQGWDGENWQTIDSRTGYSISDWESNNSRQFTIQYPEEFEKYRLLVEEVNGSDVVSIRKFKIFGHGNGNLKSEDVSLLADDFPMNDLSINSGIEISPNPNDGRFVLNVMGLQNYMYQNDNNLDSLECVNSHIFGIDPYSSGELDDEILIEIFDVTSNKVHETTLSMVTETIDINLGHLKKGLYIIKATFNGRKTVTKKFIIE
jgi:hypothetical protein